MEVSARLDSPVALSPELAGQEAGWAREQVWTLWREEKFLALLGTLKRPSTFSLVSILTQLSGLF
jgi:hypothetical protein